MITMKKQSNNQSTDYRNTGLPEYRITGGPKTGTMKLRPGRDQALGIRHSALVVEGRCAFYLHKSDILRNRGIEQRKPSPAKCRQCQMPSAKCFLQSAIRNLAYRQAGPQSAIKKTGFTLMEVMMSMGILVIGLAMVATAFPTAMLETKRSVADTTATMVSENAAAICRVKLSHSSHKDLIAGTLADTTALINNPAHDGDLTYPVNTPGSLYGWLLVAQQPSGNETNDYQLVIVPYRKFLSSDLTPTFSDVTVDGTGEKITGDISIGSPVICKFDGTFAYVLDSTGALTNKITSGAALAVGADGQDSPAIGCYVVRTAVAP